MFEMCTLILLSITVPGTLFYDAQIHRQVSELRQALGHSTARQHHIHSVHLPATVIQTKNERDAFHRMPGNAHPNYCMDSSISRRSTRKLACARAPRTKRCSVGSTLPNALTQRCNIEMCVFMLLLHARRVPRWNAVTPVGLVAWNAAARSSWLFELSCQTQKCFTGDAV